MSVLKNSNFFTFFITRKVTSRGHLFYILHVAITMLYKAQMEYCLAANPTLGCGL